MARWATLLVILLVLTGGCLGPLQESLDPAGSEGPPSDEAGPEEPPADDEADASSGSNGTSPEDPAPRNRTGSSSNATANGTYGPGWPPLEEALVRPGVDILPLMEPPARSDTVMVNDCTVNFVFSSPDNRTLYVGTAAHCVVDRDVGDEVRMAGGRVAGTLVYDSYELRDEVNETNLPSFVNDFALVRIPDEHRDVVHPAVLHWGGPTGIAPRASVGDRVLTYGSSPLRVPAQDPSDAREGYVQDADANYTGVHLAGPSIQGDSGSPLLTVDGRALAVVNRFHTWPPYWADPGRTPLTNGGGNLAPLVAFMEEHTDLEVELETWALLEEPTLPPSPVDPDTGTS